MTLEHDDDSEFALVAKARGARENMVNVLTDYAFSPNPVLRGYAQVTSLILKRLGSLQGGGVDTDVDMKPLKELARSKLPPNSQLRKLLEAEKDSVSFESWLGKMEIYASLLNDETHSHSSLG